VQALAGTDAGEGDFDIRPGSRPDSRIILSARSTILTGWPMLRT
jgi:hypothetical protein